MKKHIIMVLASLLILVACNSGQKLTEQPKFNKNIDSKVQLKEEIQSQKVVVSPEERTEEELEHNLLKHNLYGIYDSDQPLDYVKTCSEIPESSIKALCYWITAMTVKDEYICDYMPSDEEIMNSFPKDLPSYKQGDSEYLSKGSCHKAINFKNDKVHWKLTSGLPPYADPSNLLYEGDNLVRGWLVYTPSYVGDPSPHFHIEDRGYLPDITPTKFKDFQISLRGEKEYQILEELKNSSEAKPVFVRANLIQYRMEGTPSITITEVL